jgi:hypothetical protein
MQRSVPSSRLSWVRGSAMSNSDRNNTNKTKLFHFNPIQNQHKFVRVNAFLFGSFRTFLPIEFFIQVRNYDGNLVLLKLFDLNSSIPISVSPLVAMTFRVFRALFLHPSPPFRISLREVRLTSLGEVITLRLLSGLSGFDPLAITKILGW